jgi:hypothetical protein
VRFGITFAGTPYLADASDMSRLRRAGYPVATTFSGLRGWKPETSITFEATERASNGGTELPI